MNSHITINFDKPQEQIAIILGRFHLPSHNIMVVADAAHMTIEICDKYLQIAHKQVPYPLLLSDFVHAIRSIYYENFIHELSVANDLYQFDARQAILKTSIGQVALTLREIILLMPIWQSSTIHKASLIEHDSSFKKIREKLASIGLLLSGDIAYQIIKKP